MPGPVQVRVQINEIIGHLAEIGLTNDQQFAFERGSEKSRHVVFEGAELVTMALGNPDYAEVYRLFLRERAYNVRMLDGALIQMSYLFTDRALQIHRLAFYPSPYLEGFQSDPVAYWEDDRFAEVVDRNVVPIMFGISTNFYIAAVAYAFVLWCVYNLCRKRAVT